MDMKIFYGKSSEDENTDIIVTILIPKLYLINYWDILFLYIFMSKYLSNFNITLIYSKI